MEENRFINCEPGRDQSSINPMYPSGIRISAYTYDDYLVATETSNITEIDDWLPWEQFSALGEFYWSFWWDGSADCSFQYEYEYTDSKTGQSWLYGVSYRLLPKEVAIVNMKEYEQWYYGKEISEYYFDEIAVQYTTKDFSNPDLTKDQEVKKGIFILLDDVLRCSQLENGQLRGYISFVYNGYHVLISKLDLSKEHSLPFNSAEDHEIIRRLTNTETYMDAIKELMDPQNAQTAK